MNDKPDLTQCRDAGGTIDQQFYLDVPFAPEFTPVQCLSPERSLIATFDGHVVIAFRRGEGGLFRQLCATEAREWATDLLRAADDLDAGKGKH